MVQAMTSINNRITGHDIMDFERFAEDTRHMIVFEVLKWAWCPVGGKGDCVRIFLTNKGYRQALESERRGEMKIRLHARVSNGDLFYVGKEHDLAQ